MTREEAYDWVSKHPVQITTCAQPKPELAWKVSIGTHDGYGPDLETALTKAREAGIATHKAHLERLA